MDKEGGFVNKPPIMNGTNYDYWKAHMVAFLKSMDRKTLKEVIKVWKDPVVKDIDGKDTTNLKPGKEWSKEEDELALGNSKALSALFNRVDKNIFRMKDDECIHDFHMNILDIANSSSALGEKILEEKFVRKILKLLPKKFYMKVTTIEEAQDIFNMRVDELIGPLQTSKLAISDRSEKKNKSITFISNTKDEEGQYDLETDEGISNPIVLLERQFNKVLKKMDRKSSPNVKNISKCPTYLKKQKKGLFYSLPDDDFEDETDDETAKHVTAFTGRYELEEGSCDEYVSYEEFLISYRELCVRSEKVCKIGEKQKRIIAQLQDGKENLLSTISGLKDEVTLLNYKLENMTKLIRMLNNGSGMLDEILQVGKGVGNLKGIGFDYQSLKGKNLVTKLIPPERKANHMMIKTRKEWKPKIVVSILIAHTSLRASSREDWYFDIGYSRHVTGVKKYLVDIKSYSSSFVTFSDEAKGEIKGIGNIGCNCLPILDDVLLVKGLTTNLISISQLCDQGLKVNFTKSKCLVTNEKNDVLRRGVRYKYNLYLWIPQETTCSSTCLMSKEDDVKLWHQKLGHLNLKGMKKIASEEAIRDIPKLKIKDSKVCGISHEFSSPITPQQNGVVERKNRTLEELSRVMLHAKNLPYHFWADAMNTACYITIVLL
ncbi:uncharacterized protein LOC127101991 [Lathyrus oleraceus]|uniref:uncharacterized protein LOC127101991 n=1 Tax=Pisum sativum TaxID=3888 RepID=UPI0021D0D2F0|nr:uncharacterized protein LOC127101991 [Pisum sativum]